MKSMIYVSPILEHSRVKAGPHGSCPRDMYGGFIIKANGLRIIVSGGDDLDGFRWDHVSVSRKSKTPSYEDMVWAKQHTFHPDATVMELHVPAADHINQHNYCLHLWRPWDDSIPTPPKIMV